MLLAGWYYHFQTDAVRATQAALPAVQPPAAVAVAAAAPAVVTTAVADTRPEWVLNPPELGLTRALTGDQAVSYDGRPRTVLGTKESQAKDTMGQPVLLVRDENSGQIDYFQSGLQFRLKPGNDFSAFIAERTAMRSQFSNADYANVMVDAGNITSEFKALKNDPRVSFVSFLKPKPSLLPR